MESSRVAIKKRLLRLALPFILLITFNSSVYGQSTPLGPFSVSPDRGWAAGEDDTNHTGVLPQVISAISPTEGTLGTEITITGSGFGSTRGNVLVGNVATKILQWADSYIGCRLLKALAPATYDVTVRPRGASSIIFPGSFSVKSPEIVSVEPQSGSASDQITIHGFFFGMLKGKVTLGGKICKVLSWTMAPTTGDSEIEFVVPKGFAPGAKELIVTNGVGVGKTIINVGIPTPSGIYVLNEASNMQSTTTAYASGLTSSPGYQNDVTGHAIFVPIAKILPSITTWGKFNWDWTYLDTLVEIAVSNGKKFSVELETGFQSSSTYLQSLPSGFAATCGSNCAPLFDVWTTGGSGGRCISAYVLLPWVRKVQKFWSAAAFALADHLRQKGVYESLTLVHVPGLSVYDEELRLPTGHPSPTPTDTEACPDGRPAYPTAINDASTSTWQSYGYSDAAVIKGFKAIAAAFAQAFPDRFLGLSLFNPGSIGIDFPNLTGDPVGYVASQIVQEVNAIAPGRVQLQSDDLDSNFVLSEVKNLASQYSDFVGWQTNEHAGTGAGCNGNGVGSCNPDGPSSPYFQLLQNGALNGGTYLEAWSADVVNYPESLAAARSAGFYPGFNPSFSLTFGSPVTFATHTELQDYGFSFGPSDGQFGAIPAGGSNYTFYGTAGSTSSCTGTPNAKEGAFTFTGTLDHVTGSNGCTKLFGPGDGPTGWVFDKDYAGGGQVVRFASGETGGWLMPFHGEVWWQNPATPDHKCTVAGGSGSKVNCFYSSIGLAVSADGGKTFEVAGQILQPSQPMSFFTGGGSNMAVGYGSLLVADANGKHLDNPPADTSGAYFYLFYTDFAPDSPGVCATAICMGVARARYADVVSAALSGDPHQVATVFRKYDGASPDPWTQPATSDTPDLSGTAGRYAALWTDEPAGSAQVIYDSSFDVYLAVYGSSASLKVRASSDLIHWSGPIGAPIQEPGRTLYYPTLIGETGDPTIAGSGPRVYFTSFPTGSFPNYTTSVFESVPLALSLSR